MTEPTKLKEGTLVRVKSLEEIRAICIADDYIIDEDGDSPVSLPFNSPTELNFDRGDEILCGQVGPIVFHDEDNDVEVKLNFRGEECEHWLRREWVELVSPSWDVESNSAETIRGDVSRQVDRMFGPTETTQHKRPTINLGEL